MTFHENSPFHVLITSYQLVSRCRHHPPSSRPDIERRRCEVASKLIKQAVQDEKYFQGMKWQYMILDEAQAIKSSSSARWKSLLSLHCRNRLLLTGTPIQNSMHGKLCGRGCSLRRLNLVARRALDMS